MMPGLWSQLFRVMDDVHEGTRNAAASTTRIFAKVSNMSVAVVTIVYAQCTTE